MKDLSEYSNSQPTERKSFNAKKTIVLTLLGGSVACAIYIYISKQIKDKQAEKSDAKGLTQGAPATIASQLNHALTGGFSPPQLDRLRLHLIAIKSQEELDLVRIEYKNQYGKLFNTHIKEIVKGPAYDEMVAILEAKPSKNKPVSKDTRSKAWARRMKAAFDKKWLGFNSLDTDALLQVLKEVPSRIAFIDVGRAYYDLFKDNVLTILKRELHFWEYDNYMKILTDKPKGK